MEKEYLCLLVGRLQQNEGILDFPLPGREGKTVPARTRFKVAKRFSETTLVKADIATGRMHQIRLHFARYGHPVVMDDQHGDFSFNKRFRKDMRPPPPVPSRIDGYVGIPRQEANLDSSLCPPTCQKLLNFLLPIMAGAEIIAGTVILKFSHQLVLSRASSANREKALLCTCQTHTPVYR